ncbi:hypothetical protein ECL_01695 [Enterobacter cloacae subsp. cloacae ATCC 13047]|uniref:Uncharacterized protein n=1 Tax=Enterobacter cloacae subsp. cloacae (strain ATCC 13047 / DSM 30054 / NBRC 13535 / NCTC 10005 / WDCM 00083 / NCDC 279-56) TaxID=716541 RepID=A0A0H3CL08_ENTCC|nr:hypothetical protein ECL_01695 [Enterobacter cloacae subsp. cloacae ATCC 13047]OOC92151.1 hypothetical protein BWP06_04200 [Enterobacter cloacae]
MRAMREILIKHTFAALFPCIYEESARIDINHPQTRAITGIHGYTVHVGLRT